MSRIGRKMRDIHSIKDWLGLGSSGMYLQVYSGRR